MLSSVSEFSPTIGEGDRLDRIYKISDRIYMFILKNHVNPVNNLLNK